jgi:hypothetical protein
MKMYSYVVRYDSGFAPNPFYGYCTLATCKPPIRKSAEIGDWLIGCGSADRSVQRGGYLVYAMRITETLTFDEYNADLRFAQKQPFRSGSRKQSCGDNIYKRNTSTDLWVQRDSFHSLNNGAPNPEHIAKDTKVNRVLVSEDFVYFGGYGPSFPDALRNFDGFDVCKIGIGCKRFDHQPLILTFIEWIRSMAASGYSGYQFAPFEWRHFREQAR